MARLSTVNPPPAPPDPTPIQLNRVLARLQATLITPSSETESRLRTSSLERESVGRNIEIARSLLVKLEQDAQNIKVQSRKQETQTDLVQRRDMIQRLSERLQEFNELGEYEANDTSEGEDLLGEDTPSEETDSHSHADTAEPDSPSPSPIEKTPPPFIPQVQAQPPPVQASEPQSILRARKQEKEARADLLTPASTTTGISTATSEVLLAHHRTEQEDLTNSLLAMATALRESSQAFSTSLEEEKGILDGASKGLDKSEVGLETATRKMGYLRSMTEGRGWLGRMLMYAYIAGLMVLAILIVFVMPKIRF